MIPGDRAKMEWHNAVEDMAKKHGIDFTSAMARVRKEQPALFNAFNAVRLPE